MPSQALHPVGTCNVAWPNTSGLGSPTLTARVHYPAVTPGFQAPVLPSPNRWPVVVFLHGYSLLGSAYSALGDAWAQAGFIVVLSETAQWNYIDQEHDGRALYDAVLMANAAPSTLLSGAIDTTRIALAGHSMGGGNVGAVLAANPGYACGFALAPLAPAPSVAAMVEVPFGIAVGAGDSITPWYFFAQPFFATLGSIEGLKFLYLMNDECTHMNIAGLGAGPLTEVFERAADLGIGFLDHFMGLSVSGLDAVVGPPALADPHLLQLSQEVAVPQVWADSELHVGVASRLSVIAQPGLAGLLAAFAPGPGIPTPLGILALDPATAFTLAAMPVGVHQRFDVMVQIPNQPSLVGLPLVLQAIGATPIALLWLGSTLHMSVRP
ncbi:MAG: hypothetical protein ABIP94_11335 [Planctomycetota bacterium]